MQDGQRLSKDQPNLGYQYCQYDGNHMKGPADPRIVMSRVPRSIHPGSASLVFAAFARGTAMYEHAESGDQWEYVGPCGEAQVISA